RELANFALTVLNPVANDDLPTLKKCLDDPDLNVQDAAAICLGTIHQQPVRVIPVLSQLVAEHRNGQEARVDALWSLGRFGGQAKTAVPTLIELVEDHEEYIRFAATNALKAIDEFN